MVKQQDDDDVFVVDEEDEGEDEDMVLDNEEEEYVLCEEDEEEDDDVSMLDEEEQVDEDGEEEDDEEEDEISILVDDDDDEEDNTPVSDSDVEASTTNDAVADDAANGSGGSKAIACKSKLHPYQTEGVEFIQQKFKEGRHALLADDMGLGKTLQALCSIAPYVSPSNCEFALIVCPKSAINVWVKEAGKHFRGFRLASYDPKRMQMAKPWYLQQLGLHGIVCNYERLTCDGEDSILFRVRWKVIVLDECHLLRSINTQRSKAVHKLRCEHKLCVTGTPTNNKVSDLYNVFKFLGLPVGTAAQWEPCKVSKSRVQMQREQKTLMDALSAVTNNDEDDDNNNKLSAVETTSSSSSKLRASVAKWMERQYHSAAEIFLYARELLSEVMIRRKKLDLPPLSINEMTLPTFALDKEQQLYQKVVESLNSDIKDYRGLATESRSSKRSSNAYMSKRQIRQAEEIKQQRKYMQGKIMAGFSDLVMICSWAPLVSPEYFTEQEKAECSKILMLDRLLEHRMGFRDTRANQEDDEASQKHRLQTTGAMGPFISSTTTAAAAPDTVSVGSKRSREECADTDTETVAAGSVDAKEHMSRKIVIFSRFKDLLRFCRQHILEKYGVKSLYIDGEVGVQKRDKIIDQFQNDKKNRYPVLLITTKTGGMGITLTAANRAVFLDTEYNPKEGFEQPLKRIHRIGQTLPCFVTVMHVESSLESKIRERCQYKNHVANALVGDDDSDLDEVVASLSGMSVSLLDGTYKKGGSGGSRGASSNNNKSLLSVEGVAQILEQQLQQQKQNAGSNNNSNGVSDPSGGLIDLLTPAQDANRKEIADHEEIQLLIKLPRELLKKYCEQSKLQQQDYEWGFYVSEKQVRDSRLVPKGMCFYQVHPSLDNNNSSINASCALREYIYQYYTGEAAANAGNANPTYSRIFKLQHHQQHHTAYDPIRPFFLGFLEARKYVYLNRRSCGTTGDQDTVITKHVFPEIERRGDGKRIHYTLEETLESILVECEVRRRELQQVSLEFEAHVKSEWARTRKYFETTGGSIPSEIQARFYEIMRRLETDRLFVPPEESCGGCYYYSPSAIEWIFGFSISVHCVKEDHEIPFSEKPFTTAATRDYRQYVPEYFATADTGDTGSSSNSNSNYKSEYCSCQRCSVCLKKQQQQQDQTTTTSTAAPVVVEALTVPGQTSFPFYWSQLQQRNRESLLCSRLCMTKEWNKLYKPVRYAINTLLPPYYERAKEEEVSHWNLYGYLVSKDKTRLVATLALDCDTLYNLVTGVGTMPLLSTHCVSQSATMYTTPVSESERARILCHEQEFINDTLAPSVLAGTAKATVVVDLTNNNKPAIHRNYLRDPKVLTTALLKHLFESWRCSHLDQYEKILRSDKKKQQQQQQQQQQQMPHAYELYKLLVKAEALSDGIGCRSLLRPYLHVGTQHECMVCVEHTRSGQIGNLGCDSKQHYLYGRRMLRDAVQRRKLDTIDYNIYVLGFTIPSDLIEAHRERPELQSSKLAKEVAIRFIRCFCNIVEQVYSYESALNLMMFRTENAYGSSASNASKRQKTSNESSHSSSCRCAAYRLRFLVHCPPNIRQHVQKILTQRDSKSSSSLAPQRYPATSGQWNGKCARHATAQTVDFSDNMQRITEKNPFYQKWKKAVYAREKAQRQLQQSTNDTDSVIDLEDVDENNIPKSSSKKKSVFDEQIHKHKKDLRDCLPQFILI